MMAINAEKLSTGLQEAQLGSVVLNEGATYWQKAWGNLKEKTAGFDTELATSALDSLLGEPFRPHAVLCGLRNKAVQTLQFIIRTEEISARKLQNLYRKLLKLRPNKHFGKSCLHFWSPSGLEICEQLLSLKKGREFKAIVKKRSGAVCLRTMP